jgi:hypothetical protein
VAADGKSATLNWVHAIKAFPQTLYFDDNQANVNAAMPGTVNKCTGCMIKATLGDEIETYPAVNLTPNTTYYWKVVNNPDNTDCDKASTVR